MLLPIPSPEMFIIFITFSTFNPSRPHRSRFSASRRVTRMRSIRCETAGPHIDHGLVEVNSLLGGIAAVSLFQFMREGLGYCQAIALT